MQACFVMDPITNGPGSLLCRGVSSPRLRCPLWGVCQIACTACMLHLPMHFKHFAMSAVSIDLAFPSVSIRSQSRIVDMLLSLPSSQERLACLPDCFTPPAQQQAGQQGPGSTAGSSGGDGDGSQEGADTEELWCTPSQLLNEVRKGALVLLCSCCNALWQQWFVVYGCLSIEGPRSICSKHMGMTQSASQHWRCFSTLPRVWVSCRYHQLRCWRELTCLARQQATSNIHPAAIPFGSHLFA